jgi:hypothetical protein
MTTVVHQGREELVARRARLLDRARMSWEELSELADSYTLSADERSIYEAIRGIDYLLDADQT